MGAKIKTHIVDSFTDTPFKGNPAGVCILEDYISEEKMQLIAKELNLSETAFIQKTKREGYYSIRYFSPKMEIPLCGHATLASAKLLFKEYKSLSELHFNTIEGLDLVVKNEEPFLVMYFPLYDTVPIEVSKPMLDALGIRNIINSRYNKEINSILVEIEDNEELKSISPNFEQLLKTHHSIDGVAVTALAKNKNHTFESRYFWPWSGSNEDPVTGATHTFLAKYWGDKLNLTKMVGFQCSERTGILELEIDNDVLKIRGEAQIILTGEIEL